MTKLIHLTGDKDRPTVAVDVEPLDGDRISVSIDGEAVEVEAFETERGVAFRIAGRSYDLPVDRRGDSHVVSLTRGKHTVELVDERVHKLRSALGVGAGALKPELHSPMTGKVVLVQCAVGDTVVTGSTLVIIEAMKMENEIKAPGDATIKAINVAAGDLVVPGDVLVAFEFEQE